MVKYYLAQVVRVTDIRFGWLVYVSKYCVRIATLNNKQEPDRKRKPFETEPLRAMHYQVKIINTRIFLHFSSSYSENFAKHQVHDSDFALLCFIFTAKRGEYERDPRVRVCILIV